MNVSCPLCEAEQYSIVFSKSLHMLASIVKCNNCNHYYTFQTNEIDHAALYNDEVYKVVDNRSSVFDKILNTEYRKVIRKIISFKPVKGNLLDFGSGKGKFASLTKDYGWKVKGVETSPERAAYAKEIYGLEINTDFYEKGNLFEIQFDVLTLFHVLEHLPHPKRLFKELIDHNLKKDALIVIEVPNFKSFQSYIAKCRWIQLDVARHLSHFTPETLDRFCNELNLTSVKKNFFSLHLGLLGMTDSLLKLLGYKGNIIYQLKNKKSFLLIIGVIFLLPFALVLEYFSSFAGKGGIIRGYYKRNSVVESK